jgi:hypothetical protein
MSARKSSSINKASISTAASFADRSPGLVLFIIVSGALVLRLIKMARMPLISPDGPGYINDALAIGTKGLKSLFLHGFTGNFSIYSIALYVVNSAVGDPIISGQLVSLFFGLLLIVAVYFVAKAVMGPRAGLLAAFLTAVHPHLIRYSVDVLKDTMLFFFAIASVAIALIGHEKRKYLLVFLAGIMAWTTSVVRIFGVVVVVSISVAIIVSGIIERRRPREIAAEFLLFTLPAPAAGYILFALLVGPNNEYIIQSLMGLLQIIMERFSAIASYRDILITHNPGVDPSYLDVITSYPSLSAFAEFINVFVTAISGFPFVLFLFGIFLDRSNLVKRGPRLFVLICAGMLAVIDYAMLTSLFFISKRHIMILVLLVLPWAALTLDRFIAWYGQRVEKRYRMTAKGFSRIVVTILVVWALLAVAFTSFFDIADNKHIYKREAADYIKGLGQTDPLIVVLPTDRAIPIYAGGHEIILSDAAELREIIAKENPNFILWDTSRGTLPEPFETLTDLGVIEPIKTIEGRGDNRILIFRRTGE